MASKKVLKQNAQALQAYGYYKETTDLLDRVAVATGKKASFKVAVGSTVNFQVNQYGVTSNTAQKI